MEDWFDKTALAILLGLYLSAMIAAGSVIAALPVMLALGVIHNDITTHVPALGYWATMLVLWGGGTVITIARPSTATVKR